MTLVNIQNLLILFFQFLPEFRCSNIFAMTKHTLNQFGHIRWVFRNSIIYSQNLHFN
jgi:hypothetical protein